MKYQHEILKRETVCDGFLKINHYRLRHSLFVGGWSGELVRERVEGYRAAAVLPYDPIRDEVVLIEQFRVGAMGEEEPPWLLEVVGGIIEGIEYPEEVARRETLEEMGCDILELAPICEFLVSPGTSSERVFLFCGRINAEGVGGVHGVDSEGEDIRVQVFSFKEAMGELYGGLLNSTTAIIGMQWLAINREELRARWGNTLG